MDETESIVIPRWFDRHAHFREGVMTRLVLPWTLEQKAFGAVVMGNLEPPNETSTVAKTVIYRNFLEQHLPEHSNFKFCMTCYLTDTLLPEELVAGFQDGIWCAVKMFLTTDEGGGSTNSSRAVRNLAGRKPVFEVMNRYGIPMLCHCESPEDEVDPFDKEYHCFTERILPLAKKYPGMPVVIEHVSDYRVAEVVASEVYENLYATSTAHHLMTDRRSLFRGGLNPVNYCLPVFKREEHPRIIRRIICSGSKRFGAGLDSAAHRLLNKSKAKGCNAGMVTAPVGAELYATVFEEEKALKNYGNFMSMNLLHLFGLKPSTECMTLVRETQEIPTQLGDVLIFDGKTTMKRTTLPWTLKKG